MGTFVRLVQGVWEQTATGEWRFDENPTAEPETVVIHPNDPFEGLVEMIRIRLDLGVLTPVALTYQLPDWMLEPEGLRTPPVTLETDTDVERMLGVMEYMTQPLMYVTFGPELVAKYQFLRRSPFTVGERKFLEEGVTDEQHHEAIKDLVGGRPIVCSRTILEMMFNEPQLLIVYRVALEIEMVYAPSAAEREELPRLNVDDIISMDESEAITNDENYNPLQNQPVLHGEPVDYDDLQRTQPNGLNPNSLPHGVPLEVQPLNQIPPLHPIWEDLSDQERAYLEEVFEAEENLEVQVQVAQHATTGSSSLPIGPNLRVTAPTSPNTVLLVESEQTSYTGSSDGLDETQNPLSQAIPITENIANMSDALSQGSDPAPVANGNIGPLPQVNINGPSNGIATNGEPNLELSLAFGMNNNHGTEATIVIEDSDDEVDGNSGGFGPDPLF